MRHRWLRSLALSLGVLVMGQAGVSCLAMGAETTPNIQPYPPPPPAAELALAEEPAPSAILNAPVAVGEEASKVDQEIQPAGLFSGRFGRSMPAGIDEGAALTSPASTTIPNQASQPDVPYSWKQPGSSSLMTSNGTGTNLAPMPSIVSSPAPTTPNIGASPTAPVINGPIHSTMLDGGGCAGDGCCTADGCDGCGLFNNCCGNGCNFGNRWFGSAEYLLWFIQGQNLPPLLTSGSIADNPPGAIGQPGTSVLFGGNNFSNNPYSGLRLRGGYWFNDNHGLGLELGGFFLGAGSNTYSNTSLGVPFLARPFVNALTGAQDIEAVASPNGLTGTFTAVNTFLLYGAEANLRRNLLCGCNWFIDGFAGWRMLGLNESLSLRENLAVVTSSNPNLPAGTTFVVNDRFATTNLFNGAQIGAAGEYRLGRWCVDVRGSVALGGTEQFVAISGSTFAAAPGIAGTTSQGGLLAQSSNIGRYARGTVSMVDEIGINLGYQFTNHIRGFVGYNFLYWTSVVRPGNQIDTVVNPNLIPPSTGGGPARPAFNFNSSDFWAQGLTFGIDIRW
jgi:hypothetical protein